MKRYLLAAIIVAFGFALVTIAFGQEEDPPRVFQIPDGQETVEITVVWDLPIAAKYRGMVDAFYIYWVADDPENLNVANLSANPNRIEILKGDDPKQETWEGTFDVGHGKWFVMVTCGDLLFGRPANESVPSDPLEFWAKSEDPLPRPGTPRFKAVIETSSLEGEGDWSWVADVPIQNDSRFIRARIEPVTPPTP